MKIGFKTIKSYQHYWRQSPAEVRRRLEAGGWKAYREKRSKMMAITGGKEKMLAREHIEKVKVSAEPVLMRCSYDLEIGGATRESPRLIFEFQFFVTVGRLDAERWCDGHSDKVISEEAKRMFDIITSKNRLSGDMTIWLYHFVDKRENLAQRRYAEAQQKDKAFIRLIDDRGTGKHTRCWTEDGIKKDFWGRE